MKKEFWFVVAGLLFCVFILQTAFDAGADEEIESVKTQAPIPRISATHAPRIFICPEMEWYFSFDPGKCPDSDTNLVFTEVTVARMMKLMSVLMKKYKQASIAEDSEGIAEFTDVMIIVSEQVHGRKPPRKADRRYEFDSNSRLLRARLVDANNTAKAKNKADYYSRYRKVGETCFRCHSIFLEIK